MTSSSVVSVDYVAKPDEDASISLLSNESQRIYVYPYRWVILALYSLTAFSNTLVWLSLFTVSDATCVYYRISEAKLVWSSTAFTALQVIVAIPVTLVPSRLGLRKTMILASLVNAIGASIMIASTKRGGFSYFVAGQGVIALAAAILPQLAPQVSAIWFGEKEHAFSTSVGIIIGNAGAAVGFLQPALMISNIEPEKHIDFVDKKLKELIYSQAVLCILLLLLVLILFKKEPPLPPSLSQAVRMRSENNVISIHGYRNAYKVLLKNKNYLLCGNAFAINNLLVITVPVFLNAIVSWKFPRHDADIGWMGFGGIMAGIVGSVVFTIVLDKTKSYKRIAIFLGVSNFVVWIGFTEALAYWNNLSLIITLFIVCCFVFIPFGPVVVDMITEMTYPISESMSFVLPITAGRLYSIPVVIVLGYLIERDEYHLVCFIIAGVIALTVCLVALSEEKKIRTEAGR